MKHTRDLQTNMTDEQSRDEHTNTLTFTCALTLTHPLDLSTPSHAPLPSIHTRFVWSVRTSDQAVRCVVRSSYLVPLAVMDDARREEPAVPRLVKQLTRTCFGRGFRPREPNGWLGSSHVPAMPVAPREQTNKSKRTNKQKQPPTQLSEVRHTKRHSEEKRQQHSKSKTMHDL